MSLFVRRVARVKCFLPSPLRTRGQRLLATVSGREADKEDDNPYDNAEERLLYNWSKSLHKLPQGSKMDKRARTDPNGVYRARKAVVDEYKKHMRGMSDQIKSECKQLLNEGILTRDSASKVQSLLDAAAKDDTPPMLLDIDRDTIVDRGESPPSEEEIINLQEGLINTPPFVPLRNWDEGLEREHTVFTKRVSNMTRGGRRPSMSVLAIVGNGDGGVGYAVAKSNEGPIAEEQAIKKAYNKMVFVPRLDKRTITHDIQVRFKKTKLYMQPAKKGRGIKAHPLVRIVCENAGITDLTADLFGSKNPLNIVKCAMKALQSQVDPVELAKNRGKILLKIDDPGKMPQIMFKPTANAHVKEVSQSEKKKLFGNWLMSFPSPQDIVSLGEGKKLYDAFKASNALSDNDNADEVVIGANVNTKEVGVDVLKWFGRRPMLVLDEMDFTAHSVGSFLDSNFWPGGVDTCMDMARQQQ
eukprot:m.25083 g.25083  ORF g.25083 m.25083 type:complete len:470 (+) comp9168_c0_seq1:53-1462(+)